MELLRMTVPGDPVAKGRPRLGSGGSTYTPEKTSGAESVIGYLARRRMAGKGLYTGPVGLSVEFFCATDRKTDGDNLLKLVADAMNGIVYKDDSQILEWFARLQRGVGKEWARSDIAVYSLGDEPRGPGT